MTEPAATSAVVRRVMPAPPDVVFDAWLDREALMEFLSPDPARATEVECDPRVGGRLRIVMVDPEGAVEITGEYVEIDRPRRLRFTWGHRGGVDSVVTITFERHGRDETLMTIRHDRLPPEQVPDHESGWTTIAGKLGRRLGA
jgi:uncharacterized protein YndB with AHSA1/START domain